MTTIDMKPFTDANKETYEAFKDLVELNQKVLERTIDFQRTIMESAVDKAKTQAQKAGKATDFQTLVEIQAEATREGAEEVMETTRKAYELLEQARTDFSAWMEKSAKQVMDATKAA